MDIGKRIKAARTQRGWSQAELGERCGYEPQVAKQRISHYETGGRKLSLAEVQIVARTLGVKPEWLAFGVDPGERLDDQERAILHIWRTADLEMQSAIWALLTRLAGEEASTPPFPASRPALVIIPSTD